MANKKKIVTPAVKALRKEVLTLAKRANERLRSLEVAGMDKESNAYRYIEKNLANKNYMRTDFKGNVRYRTDVATMNTHQLKLLKQRLDEFYQAKTTTIKGIKKKYKKAYLSFKEKTGYKGKLEDYMEMWKDARFEVIQKQYGISESVELMIEIRGFGITSQNEILDSIVEAQLCNQTSIDGILSHIRMTRDTLSSEPTPSKRGEKKTTKKRTTKPNTKKQTKTRTTKKRRK